MVYRGRKIWPPQGFFFLFGEKTHLKNPLYEEPNYCIPENTVLKFWESDHLKIPSLITKVPIPTADKNTEQGAKTKSHFWHRNFKSVQETQHNSTVEKSFRAATGEKPNIYRTLMIRVHVRYQCLCCQWIMYHSCHPAIRMLFTS